MRTPWRVWVLALTSSCGGRVVVDDTDASSSEVASASGAATSGATSTGATSSSSSSSGSGGAYDPCQGSGQPPAGQYITCCAGEPCRGYCLGGKCQCEMLGQGCPLDSVCCKATLSCETELACGSAN